MRRALARSTRSPETLARLLRDEDFRDDRKDAGELGSGHDVTGIGDSMPEAQYVPVIGRIAAGGPILAGPPRAAGDPFAARSTPTPIHALSAASSAMTPCWRVPPLSLRSSART